MPAVTVHGDTQQAISSLTLTGVARGSRHYFDLLRLSENGFRIYSDPEKTALIAESDSDPFWQEIPTGPGAEFISEATLSGARPYPQITDVSLQNWTAKTLGSDSAIRSFASNGSRILAGGDVAGTGVNLKYSDDFGETWNDANWGNDFHVYSIVWTGTQFVGVGQTGKIRTSTTGTSWTTRTSGTAQTLISVAVEFGGGTIVAVGEGSVVLTSPDGITWSSQTIAAGDNYGVCNSSAFGFIIVQANGDVYTSPSGVTWTFKSSLGITANSIVNVPGGFTVVVGNGGVIRRSSDLLSWTNPSSGTSSPLYSVKWIEVAGHSYHVAVGSSGTVLISTDSGDTWAAPAGGSGTSALLIGAGLFPDVCLFGGVGGDVSASIIGFRVTSYPTAADRTALTNATDYQDVPFSAQPVTVSLETA
jgi:hypothetical protein